MGELRQYELYVILRPDLDDEEIQAFVDQFTQLVTARRGVVVSVEVKGLRKLAYAIQKVPEGRDAIFHLYLPGGVSNDLERLLQLNESVLRYLTTRIAGEVEAALPLEPLPADPEEEKNLAAPNALENAEEEKNLAAPNALENAEEEKNLAASNAPENAEEDKNLAAPNAPENAEEDKNLAASNAPENAEEEKEVDMVEEKATPEKEEN